MRAHWIALLIVAGCGRRPPAPITEPVSVPVSANIGSDALASPHATSAFDDWPTYEQVSTVARSGDGYFYEFEVLSWDELTFGRIRISGWQHQEELLCRLRSRDTEHLDFLFEAHGPQDELRSNYADGKLLATVTKHTPEVEWGALQPLGRIGEDEGTPRATIPSGAEWDDLYPDEFVRIPQISDRLERLLGETHDNLRWSLRIQSKAQRRGTDILMSGALNRDSLVRAGISYDTARDEMHVFIYDPECKERLDEWSEHWPGMTSGIQGWIATFNERRLPVRRNRASRKP